MNQSLLSGMYVRHALFQRGQLVYLRNPKGESGKEARRALKSLREQIGSGPFKALHIQDTPGSKTAPQCVTLANASEDMPLQTAEGPLQVSGYYLSSEPS